MSNLPYQIHEHLTANRRQNRTSSYEIEHLPQLTNDVPNTAKEYPRMPRIPLGVPMDTPLLRDVLAIRRSSRKVISEPLPFDALSGVLHTLSMNGSGSRQHPSGGSKYPIETYVLVARGENLERGAYHYHPETHSLEHLWDLPEQLNLFVAVNEWANSARAVILFTASWWRNTEKYHDFGYVLGMLETGHMAQNVLLGAAAVNVPACPLAGLNDDVAASLLDLDTANEQPVYSIALG